MRIPRGFGAALTGAAIATLAISGLAVASHPGGYTLFGDAEHVSPGSDGAGRAVQLRSDADSVFGGIDFDIDAGTTFADLDSLATDYWFEADDSCGGGSPRFQVNVEDSTSGDEGNIFVYLGPPPNYTLCPPGEWASTGDLLEGANPIDTGQLGGGAPYDPYEVAVVKYGDYTVTGVQLVVDAGWFFADGEQTARVDNTDVNGHVYTYERAEPESSDDCKDGGWMELADDEGNSFRNQGQCIKYAMGAGESGGDEGKGTVTYNSVPNDLPGNVPSHPFQAQQTSEFGDSVRLASGPRHARSVDVIMSSWGCESGHWTTGDCATTPGATFSHPITLNLYSVDQATGDPDNLLLTSTQTFDIPFRPSADPANCEGGGRWYSEADDACYNGFANTISYKLDGNVTLPDAVIWTVAFNTTTYGHEPIGPADCSITPEGCPYDSLNVGVESFEGQPSHGEDTDENAAILHAEFAFNYCDGGADGFNELRLDDGAPGTCWEGFRPLATIHTSGGGQGATGDSE